MYLLTLNNLSYIYITIFFLLLIIVPYLNRRSNKTSEQFLGLNELNHNTFTSYNLGIIEFVVLCFLGAKFGLNGYYVVVIAVIISFFLFSKVKSSNNGDSLASIVSSKTNKSLGVVVAIYQMLCYSFLICVSIILTAKIFQSLLGWNFVNSVLSVVMFTFIYSLIGGYKSIRINNHINSMIIVMLILVTIICAYIKIGDMSTLISNLQTLAISEGYASGHYLSFNVDVKSIKLILTLLIAISGLHLLTKNTNFGQKIKLNLMSLLLRLAIVYFVILLGIIAIGTNANVKNIAGKKIVTYQAQLSDGQVGYVVKSVDESTSAKNKANIVPGIIPPIINEKTNIVEANVFNYILTGIVTMHYYLPSQISSLIIIVVLALFMTSLSNYLILSGRIYVKEIAAPLNLFDTYGDVGKLWIARIVIVLASFEGLIISYFLMSSFDLMLYLKIIFGVLFIPVLIFMALVIKK